MMERIRVQCGGTAERGCGRRIRIDITEGQLYWYADYGGDKWLRIRYCPTCGKDFSQITAKQLKENAWKT